MGTVLSAVAALAVFLTFYVVLRRRAARVTGEPRPIAWGWLAAIIVCAAIALLAGALTR